MSAKTCLLCGRPLGRVRMGSEGDFCSREHRNQYRLRRSMDCLTEANKVATLARRRENPKPLFGKALEGEEAGPRGFSEPLGIQAGKLPPLLRGRETMPPRWGRLRRNAELISVADGAPVALPAERRAFGVKLLTNCASAAAMPSGPRWKPGARERTPARLLRTPDSSPQPGNMSAVPCRLETQAADGQAAAAVTTRLEAAFSTAQKAAQEGRSLGGERSRDSGPIPIPARPTARAGRSDARLGFGEVGFSGSPDSQGRPEWVGIQPKPAMLRKAAARQERGRR